MPHLEKCLREYLESYNDNPRALVWTKTVEELVEKGPSGSRGIAKYILITILLRTLI